MADMLIIDDDLDVADALAELMAAEGHEVRVGYSGTEALDLLEERLPELALVDVEMPSLGGPGLVRQMHQINCGRERIPVVFLSGVPNLREVAAHAGTPYFLGKPYRYEDLLHLVRRALAERAPPRPPTPVPR